MKILSAPQLRDLDQTCIRQEQISSHALMERAANAFVNWFVKKFTKEKKVIVFCGPGNNGGDGLAISRLLLNLDYSVETFILKSEKYAADFIQNKELLENQIPIKIIQNEIDFPPVSDNAILLDCLFGTGLNKPLEGLAASTVKFFNTCKAPKISVDIASGLLSDRPSSDDAIVQPDFTVTFQLPKLAFMFQQNFKYVSELEIMDIGISKDLTEAFSTSYAYIDFEFAKARIRPRSKYDHKGTYGRALVIAGNYGMIGAAVLAVRGCYAAGAGLVRAYVPSCGYNILQMSVPESMTLTDPSFESITDVPDLSPYTAIGIGPGMGEGEETYNALLKLFKTTRVPLVIDAGALNIIGKHRDLLELIPAGSILTPHPKEFERLTEPVKDDFKKLELLKDFARRIRCVVLLKGALTAIADTEGHVYFNSTGNPGMATGGSGDVLSGIITGLLAQSYTAIEAAILGVFMHGFAGDIAAAQKSQPSMVAGDLVDAMGEVYLQFSKS